MSVISCVVVDPSFRMTVQTTISEAEADAIDRLATYGELPAVYLRGSGSLDMLGVVLSPTSEMCVVEGTEFSGISMFMGVSDDGDNMCDLFRGDLGIEWGAGSEEEFS